MILNSGRQYYRSILNSLHFDHQVFTAAIACSTNFELSPNIERTNCNILTPNCESHSTHTNRLDVNVSVIVFTAALTSVIIEMHQCKYKMLMAYNNKTTVLSALPGAYTPASHLSYK
ncbi:unnamed protein product [Albugo candida]|uniref:Uncharacterized protein n=1 Tax=Albugo candida TaxID=65357 RepID=A0A024GF29_9STRA|nr:unnamed protein product [Albugo candida]|eukprot:CCI45366.1 unnamed protein product [Albugo candida]